MASVKEQIRTLAVESHCLGAQLDILRWVTTMFDSMDREDILSELRCRCLDLEKQKSTREARIIEIMVNKLKSME